MSSFSNVTSIASESGTGETAQGSPSLETNQNVAFVDARVMSTSTPLSFDETRLMRMKTEDYDLNSFFSRPVRILQLTWANTTSLYQAPFDPWDTYFQNVPVENRLCNYKLLKCTLKLRISIAGNSFYYGRLLVSYIPHYTYDSFSFIDPASAVDFVTLSQYPSVILSPTGSQTVEMELPMVCPTDVFDIPTRSWTTMGRLAVKSFGTLGCVGTTPTDVNLVVYAWAENVQFSGITSVDISSLTPQSDEFSVKPVSRLASAVASFASGLKLHPVIGKYALATEIGANAMSAVASLFGFSKPTDVNATIVVRKTKPDLTTYNGPEDSHKLSLDVKQQVTVDPSVVGYNDGDELSILHIAMKPSYLHRFSWTTASPVDRHLFSCCVDPCVVRPETDGSNGGYLVTPMAYVTYPFKYWRGSIKYKFDIICSSFHRGRLRISYDPTAVASPGYAEFNLMNTMIVDIADTTSFEFCVPYSQNTAFRQHLPFGTNEINMYSTSTTPYTPLSPAIAGNGTLFVTVLSPLSTITGAAGGDISIMVTVSSCDDFEVASPTNWDLANMSFYPQPSYSPIYASVEPQSHEMTTVVTRESDKPQFKDPTDLIFMGETVRSLRQLLKRAVRVYSFPIAHQSSSASPGYIFYLPAFPLDNGYRLDSLPSNNPEGLIIPVTRAGYIYVSSSMTYLQYISRLFAARRGSLRYSVDTTKCSYFPNYVQVNRSYPYPLMKLSQGNLPAGANWTKAEEYEQHRRALGDSAGHAGSVISNATIEPVVSFELPHQNNLRYFYSRNAELPSATPISGSFTVNVAKQSSINSFINSEILDVWVSAGEDYSLAYFVGAPRLYRNINLGDVV
uniref:Capsid protein n=1 Tax=Biomphalaria pfeifferi virus 1 TaxID=2884319 RepID=A0A8K1P6I4_9VIRU|nr:MAG: capsid protein precursor [Biomphalaria pfeifferi virus 1]